MRKNKIAVCLMTALLLPVMALTELVSMQEENYPLSAEILTSGGSEKIACWWKQGCYYVFLPSGADPNRTKLVTDPLDLMFLFWAISIGIICGAGMAQIAVILSVGLTVGLLFLDKLPVAKAPMILVVNAQGLETEDAVCLAVAKYAKHYSVKSRNVSAQTLDLVLELRTAQGAELVRAVNQLGGVQSVSLMSHDGEVSF